jgi:hypothetical protein
MGKECQKLTAQPRALAGSMEVDGYENPEAENQGFTSRGGSPTRALFRFTTRPRRISPQYRWAKLGCFRSLGGGGGCWNTGPCIYGGDGKVCERELGMEGRAGCRLLWLGTQTSFASDSDRRAGGMRITRYYDVSITSFPTYTHLKRRVAH